MRKSDHWRDGKERAAGNWQFSFMLSAYRFCGVKGSRFIIYPIVFVFCLFAPAVMSFSRSYLLRVATFCNGPKPSWRKSFFHIVSFVYAMFEKMAAWTGDVSLESVRFHQDDVSALIKQLEEGQGAVIICSHMGNMEVLRALASYGSTAVNRSFKVTSIVDFSGTSRFNAMIKKINPDSMTRLVNARDIGVDTVIDLKERLVNGELLVIAGDRVSSTTREKKELISFFGEAAGFPQGAFILASVMEAPVYFMFALRENDLEPMALFDMHVIRSSISFVSSRKERKERIRDMIREYVCLLEQFACEHPLQWYNFYNFWRQQ